jgi:hypothetical protein
MTELHTIRLLLSSQTSCGSEPCEDLNFKDDITQTKSHKTSRIGKRNAIKLKEDVKRHSRIGTAWTRMSVAICVKNVQSHKHQSQYVCHDSSDPDNDGKSSSCDQALSSDLPGFQTPKLSPITTEHDQVQSLIHRHHASPHVIKKQSVSTNHFETAEVLECTDNMASSIVECEHVSTSVFGNQNNGHYSASAQKQAGLTPTQQTTLLLEAGEELERCNETGGHFQYPVTCDNESAACEDKTEPINHNVSQNLQRESKPPPLVSEDFTEINMKRGNIDSLLFPNYPGPDVKQNISMNTIVMGRQTDITLVSFRPVSAEINSLPVKSTLEKEKLDTEK